MNALSFLKSQHREVESLFARIEQMGEGNGRERKSLFAVLALKIEHHAKIEETIFYPAGKSATEDWVLVAEEEHDLVRFLVRKIVKIRPNDKTFQAKLSVLEKLYAGHVKEEEETFFPHCEKTLGEETLLAIGQELVTKYGKLESSVTSKRSARKAVGG